MKIFIFLLFIFVLGNCFAQEEANSSPTLSEDKAVLKEFYDFFKKGDYQDAITSLKKFEKDPEHTNFSVYWQAISYSKLQKFDEAIEYFRKADSLKLNYNDLYYEYGQALYAANKMEAAKKSFERSAAKNFKKAVSLYYVGFISQTLGDYKGAIAAYKKIDQLTKAEKMETLQAAFYQLGEIYLIQAEKETNKVKFIKRYVIPQYKLAFNVDQGTPIAGEIARKISEIEEKHGIIIARMINGRPTIRPRHYLKLSQIFNYDTNVILEANAVSNKAQYKDSWYSKTEGMARYGIYANKRYSLFPEAKINYTQYFDRQNVSVYKNDNYTITSALRNNYEYNLFNKMSTTIFDLDYVYNERDVRQIKELSFNYYYYTFMLGEKLNFLKYGETILRIKKKYFYSYSDLSDSKTESFVFEQTLNLPHNNVLMLSSNNDFSKVRSETQNTRSYAYRFDWITPRLWDLFTPTISFGYTINNPYKQKESRGLEKQYAPGFKLTRGFGQLRANFKYDYTRNISKDKTAYDYTKHVGGVEFEYLF